MRSSTRSSSCWHEPRRDPPRRGRAREPACLPGRRARSRPRSRGSTPACRSTGARTCPARVRSCSRRSTAPTSTRRSRAASPAAGCGTWARTPSGTTAPSAGCCRPSAASRSPGARLTARRCGAASKCSDGRGARAVPEGERKDGPIVQPLFDGATYVAAKAGVPIVPVGIGGSERVMPTRCPLRLPAQGARRDRPPDPGAHRRRRAPSARDAHRNTPTAFTPSCSVCTTRRSAASVAISARRRAPRRSRPREPMPATPGRGRHTARARSASTAAAHRRRRWRSRAGWR